MAKNKTVQKPWTEKDYDFLKENYGKMPTQEIADKMGRSKSSIYSRAHNLNLDATENLPIGIREKKKQDKQLTLKVEEDAAENLNSYLAALENAYEERRKQNEKMKQEILKIKESLNVIRLIK